MREKYLIRGSNWSACLEVESDVIVFVEYPLSKFRLGQHWPNVKEGYEARGFKVIKKQSGGANVIHS